MSLLTQQFNSYRQDECRKAIIANGLGFSLPENMQCLALPSKPKLGIAHLSAGVVMARTGMEFQIGIVNLESLRDAQPSEPLVFTNLTHYQSWIAQRVPDAKFYTGCGVFDACTVQVDAGLNMRIPPGPGPGMVKWCLLIFTIQRICVMIREFE